MTVDSVGRVVRTIGQAGLINAVIVLLRVFGVPITQEQQDAILGFSAALVLVVTAQNAIEDATGKGVMK